MKRFSIILVSVILLFFSLSYQQGAEAVEDFIGFGQNEDEAAIRDTMKKSIDGLNDHDIKAHLSTLTEEYETWSGRREQKVREKSLTELWKSQKSVQYRVIKENSINFVSPDIAIYNARVESNGEVKKDGTPIPANQWQGAWILAKKRGKWLIAAWFTRPIEE